VQAIHRGSCAGAYRWAKGLGGDGMVIWWGCSPIFRG